MTGRRLAFRITPRAKRDLTSIASHTKRIWGPKKRVLYMRSLDRRFTWLAENPLLGKPRPEIEPRCYCYPQGSHVIFYLISSGGVDIIGVLHRKMDVVNYFRRGEPDSSAPSC